MFFETIDAYYLFKLQVELVGTTFIEKLGLFELSAALKFLVLMQTF